MSDWLASAVLFEKASLARMIDRLAPCLAVMAAQVLCAALTLAASEHGAAGYGDLAAAHVVATPTMPRPIPVEER